MILQLPAGTEQVANELPAEYGGPRLPGAITLQDSTDSYRIFVKEISHELYRIRYHVLHFFKKTSLEYSSDKEGLHTHAALANNTQHTFPGIGRMTVREGEYTALWCKYVKGQTRFNANEDYTIFDIFYAPKIVTELSGTFAQFAEVVNAGKNIPLSRHPKWLSVAMRDSIKQMLNCPYDGPTRSAFLDMKVREYLLAALYNVYDSPKINYRFSASEKERIFEARKLLLKDLSKPGYTIKELASAVALNEFRLKTGFKYYFDSGIFETLQQARMEKAKELLINTSKSMKEIARLTGYPHTTNFMNAFKKFFGHPAGQLRRR
jgi:AraC-like DNA-binding protein